MSPGEPVLVPGIAELVLSPQAWYLFESFGSGKQNPSNSDQFMLGGASVSARFTALPQTTFTLTGLYGTNAPDRLKNQTSTFFIGPSDSGTVAANFATTTTTNTSRVDIEFRGVTRIPDSDWSWIAGGRFEHHASTYTGTQAINGIFTSSGVTQPVSASSPFRTTDAIGVYTAKGGLAVSVPMTADHRLRLFGNAMALLGFASPSAGSDFGVVGPDISVGLQYSFSPSLSADARYRLITYFLFSTPPNSASYVIYQGPMLSVNYRF
jgi:hypothetical protein